MKVFINPSGFEKYNSKASCSRLIFFSASRLCPKHSLKAFREKRELAQIASIVKTPGIHQMLTIIRSDNN
jgi:hypothetical protein